MEKWYNYNLENNIKRIEQSDEIKLQSIKFKKVIEKSKSTKFYYFERSMKLIIPQSEDYQQEKGMGKKEEDSEEDQEGKDLKGKKGWRGQR